MIVVGGGGGDDSASEGMLNVRLTLLCGRKSSAMTLNVMSSN